jgi:hypothetical protein
VRPTALVAVWWRCGIPGGRSRRCSFGPSCSHALPLSLCCIASLLLPYPTQGCKATICMPVTTPDIKVNNVRRLGGTVELVGETYQEAQGHALKVGAWRITRSADRSSACLRRVQQLGDHGNTGHVTLPG